MASFRFLLSSDRPDAILRALRACPHASVERIHWLGDGKQ